MMYRHNPVFSKIDSIKKDLLRLYKLAIHDLYPDYNTEIKAAITSLTKHTNIEIPHVFQDYKRNLWKEICRRSNQHIRELEAHSRDPAEEFITQLFLYLDDCKEPDLLKSVAPLLAIYKLRMLFILLNNLLTNFSKIEKNKNENNSLLLEGQIYKVLRGLPQEYEPLKNSPICFIKNVTRHLGKVLNNTRHLAQPDNIKEANNFIAKQRAKAEQRYTEKNDLPRKTAMLEFYARLQAAVETHDPTSPQYRGDKAITNFQSLAEYFKRQESISLPRGPDADVKNILILFTGIGAVLQVGSILTGNGPLFKPGTDAQHTIENDAKELEQRLKFTK